MTSFDPSSEVRTALRRIYREHGAEGLDQIDIVKTVWPGDAIEDRLVRAAAECGVAAMLAARVASGIPVDAAIRAVVLHLCARSGLELVACDWVVYEYALALGQVSEYPTISGGLATPSTPDRVVAPGPDVSDPDLADLDLAGSDVSGSDLAGSGMVEAERGDSVTGADLDEAADRSPFPVDGLSPHEHRRQPAADDRSEPSVLDTGFPVAPALAYEVPAYEAPAYQAPTYEPPPPYQAPSYDAPGYQAPGFEPASPAAEEQVADPDSYPAPVTGYPPAPPIGAPTSPPPAPPGGYPPLAQSPPGGYPPPAQSPPGYPAPAQASPPGGYVPAQVSPPGYAPAQPVSPGAYGQVSPPGYAAAGAPDPYGAPNPYGQAVSPGAYGPPGQAPAGGYPQAGYAQSPPSGGAEQVVKREMRRGVLAVNAADRMHQGRKERVEVGIARTGESAPEMVASLTAAPRLSVEVNTADYMQLQLVGDGFAITALSPPQQLVVPTARWDFDVVPLSAGSQSLSVIGTCWFTVDGQERALAVPAFVRMVDVEVDNAYRIKRALAGNWQWIIGTILGLGGSIAAWIALFG